MADRETETETDRQREVTWQGMSQFLNKSTTMVLNHPPLESSVWGLNRSDDVLMVLYSAVSVPTQHGLGADKGSCVCFRRLVQIGTRPRSTGCWASIFSPQSVVQRLRDET